MSSPVFGNNKLCTRIKKPALSCDKSYAAALNISLWLNKSAWICTEMSKQWVEGQSMWQNQVQKGGLRYFLMAEVSDIW